MKKVILLVLTTLLFSCNEEPINQQTFSFEAAAGIWIPYESIYADGSVFNGAFTVGIFGAYSESFN
jgi:hypothetical protein